MSLDVYLEMVRPTEVFQANITHNLNKMAKEAGIYRCLWHPDEIGVTTARDLIQPLELGLAFMKSHPEHFKTLDAPNGWGTYEQFIPWIEQYIAACKEFPEATVKVSI